VIGINLLVLCNDSSVKHLVCSLDGRWRLSIGRVSGRPVGLARFKICSRGAFEV